MGPSGTLGHWTRQDHFFERGKFVVQNGQQTRLWENWWIGHDPLKQQFPSLYRIVRKKNQSVASVLGSSPLNMSFRRALVGENLRLWIQLVALVMNTELTESNDAFEWRLTKNSNFTVKSMYSNLMQTDKVHVKCIIWKLKVPLKIKAFLWYLKKGVLLTKDNLIKRKWKGGSKCCFCDKDETIQHLFFDCHMARFPWNAVVFSFGIQPPASVSHLLGSWLRGFSLTLRKQLLVGAAAICRALWLCRNEAVFSRKLPNSFLQVIFRGTYWIRFWSQLSKEEEKIFLKINCRLL